MEVSVTKTGGDDGDDRKDYGKSDPFGKEKDKDYQNISIKRVSKKSKIKTQTTSKREDIKIITFTNEILKEEKPRPTTSAIVRETSEKIEFHFAQLQSSILAMDHEMEKHKGDKENFKTTGTYQLKHQVIKSNLEALLGLAEDLNRLPKKYQRLIISTLNLKLTSGGLNPKTGQNCFAYPEIQGFLADLSRSQTRPIRRLISSITSIESTSLQLGNIFHEQRGNVTLICPLAIDGMGDLGLAMNALDIVDKDKAEVKLVVLVGIAHPKTQQNQVDAQKEQLRKVYEMVGGNPNIEVIQVPLSPGLWGPGTPKQCESLMPESFELLHSIIGKSDVLVTVPVKYVMDGEEQLKKMLPQHCHFLSVTEYGLESEDQQLILDQPYYGHEIRVETGPLKTLFLNEGKKEPQDLFKILCVPDFQEIFPFARELSLDTAVEAFQGYSKENNLTMFYLNKETPKESVKTFLDHYLDIHAEDDRCLNIIGDIPEDFFHNPEYLDEMKVRYGISGVVIHPAGQDAKMIQTTDTLSTCPMKVLHIYSGRRFPKPIFAALSEFSATTAGSFPNLFFAGGDGSFTDALSTMVNYSSHPEQEGSITSLPIYIPRMRFHKKTVGDLINLCEQLKEPKVAALFHAYQGMVLLSEEIQKIKESLKPLDKCISSVKIAEGKIERRQRRIIKLKSEIEKLKAEEKQRKKELSGTAKFKELGSNLIKLDTSKPWSQQEKRLRLVQDSLTAWSVTLEDNQQELSVLQNKFQEPIERLNNLQQDLMRCRMDVKRLATLPEVKFGIARLCKFFKEEHNLSRVLRERINDGISLSIAKKGNVQIRTQQVGTQTLTISEK